MNSFNFDLNTLSKAFEKVKDNHGCAGVDGVSVEQFEENLSFNIKALQKDLIQKTYFPLPLLKIVVAKKNGEPRNLLISTIRDRIAQTAVLHYIGPLLEKEFEDCSYGYRKGRSIRQVVYKIREYYNQGYRWVVDSDIDAFFDTVDQGLMLEKCRRYISQPRIIDLIAQWLRAEVWDGTSLYILDKGLPQGIPVSPVLANLFLDELDEAMLQRGQKYIRYADDSVVLCKTPGEAQQALELSEQVLEKLMLELDEKDIVSFEQGFKYLGVFFLNSMIMTPFGGPKKKRQVLHYPAPFDLKSYLKERERSIQHGKPLFDGTK